MTRSTLTTLGSDHLPIIISLSSHARPHRGKARSFTNFRKADWEGYTAESGRIFADTPLPTSCSAGERVFRQILCDAGRHHIPCGYVRDYSGPLPEVVRPLMSERDQRHTDDSLDPAIKLLDQDIQRHIRQEEQDQWRSLLESSDRATDPKRYWSLLRKLGGRSSIPPLNISITFDGKRFLRKLHRHHRVDPSYRPFDERGVAAAIRKSGSSTVHGPPLPPRSAWLGLPDGALQPLCCWKQHPVNLEELRHNPDPEGREAS